MHLKYTSTSTIPTLFSLEKNNKSQSTLSLASENQHPISFPYPPQALMQDSCLLAGLAPGICNANASLGLCVVLAV